MTGRKAGKVDYGRETGKVDIGRETGKVDYGRETGREAGKVDYGRQGVKQGRETGREAGKVDYGRQGGRDRAWVEGAGWAAAAAAAARFQCVGGRGGLGVRRGGTGRGEVRSGGPQLTWVLNAVRNTPRSHSASHSRSLPPYRTVYCILREK
ncbi:hypothetical protein Pcinc_037954 [Petrolisthes cinctipes]|uniref:Uncharacterized protein n=1 Tax=Petrolisthes cinctipes TaxID=88211 RepID=A0AAE1BSI8_PETCI|nr:hypothetical protein Pcinc_037954 [Petrolisthes cinctipes]